MAVARKGKRRISVNRTTYFWYVAGDWDSFPYWVTGNPHAVNIVSEDKRLIVRYHLGQQDSEGRHITVIGQLLEGARHSGQWRRFRCPAWCDGDIVRPGDVRAIIEWCLDKTRPLIEVDWNGEPISHDGDANSVDRR